MPVRLPLVTTKKVNRMDWGALGPPPAWVRAELYRHRMKLLITRVAEHMINTRLYDLRSIPREILQDYRDDQLDVCNTARRNLKNRHIRAVLMQEIKDWCDEQGFDDAELAKMYREAFETAKANGKPDVMRDVANDIAEMRGKKNKTQASVTFDYTQVGAGKGKAKLTGSPENLLPEYQKPAKEVEYEVVKDKPE